MNNVKRRKRSSIMEEISYLAEQIEYSNFKIPKLIKELNDSGYKLSKQENEELYEYL